MSAAKGLLVQTVAQNFKIVTQFVDSSNAPVTAGTATAKVYELQSDGTLHAVDFSTTPPTIKALSTDVPATATIALANQSCAGAATPLWSTTFSGANLTAGGLYLVTFSPPGVAQTPSPRLVQYGGADGDLAVDASGRIDVGKIKGTASAGAAGTMALDMAQAVPISNTAGTLGDALNASRAQGFGKWAQVGTTLTIYGPDNTTPVRVFTLDSATNPTSRT